MAATARCVWNFLIFVGLGLAAGCAGSNDGTKDASPVPTAPALNAPARSDGQPKTAELPELPPGAGEIDPDAPQELTPTGTGLYYRILRQGDGKKPSVQNTVVIHYKGWLDDGKQFDSSYDRGEPAAFPLGSLVKGWQEGLPLVGEGGMIELEVPSDLGYGPRGSPPTIPPGATLHFIIELHKVK